MFICPADGAAGVSIEEIRRRFAAAGAHSRWERDGDLDWVVLGNNAVTLRFTTKEQLATSAVVEHTADDVSLLVTLERIFDELGWAVGDGCF
jgi:hypothetical protein